jgi:hypothetical protein
VKGKVFEGVEVRVLLAVKGIVGVLVSVLVGVRLDVAVAETEGDAVLLGVRVGVGVPLGVWFM